MLLYEYCLLATAGAAAGFINVIAGGGSLLSVPALLFLGFEGPAANGTNRISIVVQSLTASIAFLKSGAQNFRESLALSMCLIPGSILGAIWGTQIHGAWFNRLLGAVMLLVLVATEIENRVTKHNVSKQFGARLSNPMLTYIAIIVIGFYGGVIHIGIGFLIMAALMGIGKLNILETNVHKMRMIIPASICSLGIFYIHNQIFWLAGLTLASGSVVGSWLSARFSITKGEQTVRMVFRLCIIVLIVKLFFF
jgi:uncharacterized membrane protein YfcA